MVEQEKKKLTRAMMYVIKPMPKIDGEYVKALRNRLGLSQSLFAILMRVSPKTVEKWEQGRNPVTNGNIVAMILLDRNPSLLSEFIEIVEGLPEPNFNYVPEPAEKQALPELKLAKAK